MGGLCRSLRAIQTVNTKPARRHALTVAASRAVNHGESPRRAPGCKRFDVDAAADDARVARHAEAIVVSGGAGVSPATA
jgi:hypothetical protein